MAYFLVCWVVFGTWIDVYNDYFSADFVGRIGLSENMEPKNWFIAGADPGFLMGGGWNQSDTKLYVDLF